MAIVQRKCKDCNKEFDADTKSRYYRKYCDKCSKQRKKDYEKIHMISAEDCEEE